MGFRVLLLSNAQEIVAAFEHAFEPLSLSLMIAPPACLLDEQHISTLLEKESPSIIIYAGRPNIEGLSRLVEHASQRDVPVIMQSSYHVFGEGQGALHESDTPLPLCAEGQHWLACESVVLSWPHAIVVRLPWTLTPATDDAFDEGALDKLCRAILSANTIDVSEVAAGSLIAWDEAARIVSAMVQQLLCGANNWGVFHVHSSDSCSEAELADALARLLKAEGMQVAELVATKQTAPHWLSRNACLVGRRCTDNFGIQLKSFRVGLKGQVKAWLQRQSVN